MLTIEEIEQFQRWVKIAGTWLEKASVKLHWHAKNATHKEQRWLIGYNAEELLREVMNGAELLVSALNPEDIEAAYERSKKLTGKLRARHLAVKLEGAEGRTPEEAAAFAAKAEELASR